MAVLHYGLGQVWEACGFGERALGIFRKLGEQRSLGHLLCNMGVLYKAIGELERADAAFEESLDILQEVGDRVWEGQVAGVLGNLRHQQGKLEQARDLYVHAIEVAQSIGPPGRERYSLGNLATLCTRQGRMEEAEKLFEEALAFFRADEDAQWLSYLIEHELLAGGDLVRAEALAKEGMVRLKGEKLKLSRGLMHCARGHLSLAKGASAARILRSAHRVARELRVRKESELSQAISRLERSQRTFRAGRPLVAGFDPDDLEAGQLRWLREHRPEALPPPSDA